MKNTLKVGLHINGYPAETWREMTSWLYKNMKHNWYFDYEQFGFVFEDHKDELLFKLRWK